MTKPTTKADLQAQLEAMQHSLRNLPETQTLAVCSEDILPFGALERRTDLRELDHFRDHAKRRLVHRLVDELMRSGKVDFKEELQDDYRVYGKSLRVTAKITFAA